jgi:hypothetical protein
MHTKFDYSFRPVSSPKGLVELAEDTIRRLKSHGVEIPGGCRVDRYVKMVTGFYRDMKLARGANLKTVMQAVLELHQLNTILTHLHGEGCGAKLEEEVRIACFGSELPEEEKNNTPARDKQLELLLAALLKAAGYGVKLVEPDIWVNKGERSFSIAAKRAKSLGNLAKNLRDARKQIVRAGGDGVVGLDISRIYNPKNRVVVFPSDRKAPEPVQCMVDYFVGKNRQNLVTLLDDRRVFGIMVAMVAPCMLEGESRLGFSARITVANVCGLEDPRVDVLSEMTHEVGRILAKQWGTGQSEGW